MLQPLIALVLSFLFLTAVGVYLTRRMIWPLHLNRTPRRFLTSLLMALIVSAFLAPVAMFLSKNGIVTIGFTNFFQSWGYPLLGFFSILIAVLVIEDILIVLRKTTFFTLWNLNFKNFFGRYASRFRLLRRNHLVARAGRSIVMTVTLILFVVAYQNAFSPIFPEISVPVANLPTPFEGYKIALLTDTHIGPTFHKQDLQRMVDGINSARPDLVAIVGDIADGMPEDLIEDMKPLKLLRAKDGIIYVTGNHEYYWSADSWMNTLRNIGAKVLFNSSFVIRREAAALAFGGVPDVQGERFFPDHKINLEKTFGGVPHNADTLWILLAHQPKVIKQAIAAGVDLQLSGHTHGGQFFPWTWVVKLVQKHSAGLYFEGDTALFVSRGAGAWGPPLRLGVPAEVPILTLTKKSD